MNSEPQFEFHEFEKKMTIIGGNLLEISFGQTFFYCGSMEIPKLGLPSRNVTNVKGETHKTSLRTGLKTTKLDIDYLHGNLKR